MTDPSTERAFPVATLRACPKHMVASKGTRPCGCEVFICGCVLTCDDYHHGDGVLLEDSDD